MSSPYSAEAEDAARRIEMWLLSSGAQLADGPHRGGVSGRVGADGRPQYVYLEITGYFLTAMAWLVAAAASSDETAELARERGRRALAWIRTAVAGGGVPPTRIHPSPEPDDWRNQAVFTFDLAMAARGCGCFGAGDLARSLAGRVARIGEHSGVLASHELREPTGEELTERWSTRPGPHHVKAAAALLGLPPGTLDPAQEDACHATVAHWTAAMETDWPCRELHPLLYGLEGLLMLGPEGPAGSLDAAEGICARLLSLQKSDGSLPAEVGGGKARADVMAQALRAGALLGMAGRLHDRRWSERLDALALALLDRVRPDGGVPFAAGQSEANTWCAMFAHQALLAYARRDDRKLAASASRLLV